MLGWRLLTWLSPVNCQIDSASGSGHTALGVLYARPDRVLRFARHRSAKEGETWLSPAPRVPWNDCLADLPDKGCRVVGIAGSEEKKSVPAGELGADAAINYKTADMRQALRKPALRVFDVYFDNVGGEISDSVIPLIKQGARIVLCD